MLPVCFGLSIITLLSGCSVLVGNVRPVDEKDESVSWRDMSKQKEWIRLDLAERLKEKDPEVQPDTAIPDLAFQHDQTAAIISINSACREKQRSHDEQLPLQDRLKTYTQRLHFGFQIDSRKESASKIDGFSAWEVTVRGKLEEEPVMMRTVVFERKNCVYDLMYMTRPEHFPKHEIAFSEFLASLKFGGGR